MIRPTDTAALDPPRGPTWARRPLAGRCTALSASGGDVVVVDQAAEDRAAANLRGGGGQSRGSSEWHWRCLIPALVRAAMVIVGRVPREHGPQVRLVNDEQAVQARLPEGADDAPHEGTVTLSFD